MKRLIALCLIVLSLSGCGTIGKDNLKAQSVFWESFSIGTIVENNERYLLPGSRQAFGTESGSSEQPFTQKKEEITLQIDPADLTAFHQSIQSDIDEAIVNSGANIIGRGSGGVTGTSFSIDYREEDIYGVINFWGAQGEGTKFFLIVLIYESTVGG
jgi:hypothetical protein